MLDGGEVMDRGAGGDLVVAISPDALAQFQVLSSNYTPNYGIGSGGTVLMVLKSGTKQFHGGLWEFDRNDALDAQNYFTKQAHKATPELRLNIFGGNLGGPLFIPHVYNNKHSKTFFFVNEEWRKLVEGATPTALDAIPPQDFPVVGQPLDYVPLSKSPLIVPMTRDPNKLIAYADDNLTAGQPFPTNSAGAYVIPANLIDPNALLLMSTGAIPAGNFNNDTQVIQSPKEPTDVREDVVRIDQTFSSKLQLTGDYEHDSNTYEVIPPLFSSDTYDTAGTSKSQPDWTSVIDLAQTIAPTILNQTNVNAEGDNIVGTPNGIYQEPSGWSAVGIFTGNNALNRLPQIDFVGAPDNEYGTGYMPWKNGLLEYQIRDDLSVAKGKHDAQFGFSYTRIDKNQQLQADTQGDYTFSNSSYSDDSYANFLLGFASSYEQLQQLSNRNWLSNIYSLYMMDAWHVSPRLTLNLGVRYDAMPHGYEKSKQDANFVPGSFVAVNAQVPSAATGALDPTGPGFEIIPGTAGLFYMDGIEMAGVNGTPRGLVDNWYKAIQPRLGFAYDLNGRGTTVLRAGFGLFFEPIQGNDSYDTADNPPFAYQPTVDSVYFSNPNVSNVTGKQSSAPYYPSTITAVDPYYPNPATAEYSFGIQQQVAPSIVAKVGYVGDSTWHANLIRNINTLPLTDSANPADPFDDREAVANGSNANLYRIFPGFAGIGQIQNSGNASYNSLQAAIRMENVHGLTAQVAYTWSHEIDIVSNDLGTLSDPFNTGYDRGSGTIDRRNIFNMNYIYNLPFFMHSHSWLTRSALGGWQVSGITVDESGIPVNVTYTPNDIGLGGGTTNRPDLISKVHYPKTQKAWFSTSSFAAPVAPWDGGPNEGFGTARKDSVVGPGLFNWDISLFKVFQLRKRMQVQFRAESFNTFNHTEFSTVSSSFTSPSFGQVTSTLDPRTLQLAGKFSF